MSRQSSSRTSSKVEQGSRGVSSFKETSFASSSSSSSSGGQYGAVVGQGMASEFSSRISGGAGDFAPAVGQIASDLITLTRSRRESSAAHGHASGHASSHFAASGHAASSSSSSSASGAILSQVEQAILRSNIPIEVSETENLTINFQGKQETGVWANRQEVVNWRGVIPITEYIINEDMNPEVITKRTEQQLVYIQELAIRYLRPPTPPAPGEILIQQEMNTLTPPAPPLVIRQMPARASTPEPLVVREAPPQPPAAVGRKVITISGKRIPPPPRKVVIERLAPLPSKPQSVLVERWLPYAQTKRRVIFQRSAERDAVVVKPRNVIVQWEAPQVVIKKEFKYLGVIRANPAEYVQRYGATLKVARELPSFVLDIKTPDGLVLAADYKYNTVHELEGDVKALGLIDLDREGLGEYRSYLSGLGINFVGAAGVHAAAAQFQSSGSSYTAQASSSNLAIESSSVSNQGFSTAQKTTTSGSYGGALQAAALSGTYGAQKVAQSSSFGNAQTAGLIAQPTISASFGAASNNTTLAVTGQASRTTSRASGRVSADVISQIFRSIDRDNSGSISVDEAARVLLKLNSRLHRSYGEDEAAAFFKVLDTERNGQLTLEQFARAFANLL